MKSAPAREGFSSLLTAARSKSSARLVFVRLIGRMCSLARSTDDAHAAAPAQLLHAAKKIAIPPHIIPFCCHHYHEIAFALHFIFFNDTATTEIYTLSLHDALPI